MVTGARCRRPTGAAYSARVARHNHPIFTQVYRLIARIEDPGQVGRARSEAAAELSGRLLIIGIGPAEDLHHLPPAVTDVVAVEPSSSMRAVAAGAVARAGERGLPVELLDAVGEDLPLPDHSVDSVLLAYVLCTVADPGRVLLEVARVLKPGGSVGVLEHVAAPDGTWMRRIQRLAAPWWPIVGGGCHCDRRTRAAMAAAGFDTSSLREETLVQIPPVAPALIGTARRAAEA
jgi:ubiquinone/menaquinone biosynthesis C-methylase UbiE